MEYGGIEKIQSVISEPAISQGKDWLFGNEEMTFQSLTFVCNSGKKHQTTNWRVSDLTNLALYLYTLQAKCRFQGTKNWLMTSYFQNKMKYK